MGIHTGQVLHQRYEVTEQLGRGMAKTFAGLRLADDAQVVIKELKFSELDNWKAYDLFQREIKTLESLEHPAFPELLDHFEIKEGEDTWMYLVLERLPGENLQDAMEKGWRPDQQEVKRLAQKALEALSYLHHLSPPVVHRDIKPSNLIWHNQTLYLIDFGAVQDILRPEGSSTIVGTFGYMAPEQFSGPAVPASDLYALGATLVHLLSGRPPGEIPQRELRLDFREYVSCSETFCLWLEHLLEPVVEYRFQQAGQALDALLNSHAKPVKAKNKQRLSKTNKAPALTAMTAPSGTRVKLERVKDNLEISIPAGGLKAGNIFLVFFNVFWLTFVAFWTAMAAQGSLLFAMFSIPFWAVGLGMLALNVNNIFARTELAMNEQFIRIRKIYAGTLKQEKNYPLSQLTSIQKHLNYKANNVPHFCLRLEVGVKKINFGVHLSRIEKEWIKNEILLHAQSYLPTPKAESIIRMSDTKH